jgi:hypothetical protein
MTVKWEVCGSTEFICCVRKKGGGPTRGMEEKKEHK